MIQFIPRKLETVAYGLLLSGMMSFIVSGVSTLTARGYADFYFGLWIGAWLPSWAIAFPAVLIVAPIVRRILHRLVKSG